MELPGELRVEHHTCKGTVWDVSLTGSLFIPAQSVQLKPGSHGRLHLGEHLRLHIHIARVADIQTSSVPSVRAVGIEFVHLTRHEKEALEQLLAGR